MHTILAIPSVSGLCCGREWRLSISNVLTQNVSSLVAERLSDLQWALLRIGLRNDAELLSG
jgi:hypothetical protein